MHYSHTEGLPATNITSCCQDDFNRLWVGTREGVYFYSGDSFIQFLNEDYLAACAPNIVTVITDKDNCVWIGSTSGTGYYDVINQTFHGIDALGKSQVSDIDVTEDGTVWITCNDGLWKYIKSGDRLEKIKDTGSLSPNKTCVIENDNLVFTADNSFLYVYNTTLDNLRVVRMEGENRQFGYIEYMGGSDVMVSDGIKKVCRIDISHGTEQEIVGSDILENKAEIYSLMYRSGLCWIGTAYGLVIYDTSNGNIERQFPDVLDENLIGGESIRCLFTDNTGSVWAGTYNGGLRGWASYEDGFERFVSDEGPGSLVGNSVRAICEGLHGELYLGTEEGYLNRYDPVAEVFTDYTNRSHIPYGTAITDMIRVGNTIFIATYGEGVFAMDARTETLVKNYALECNDCLSMYRTPSGTLYVSTGEGLFEYDSVHDRFDIVDAVGHRFVHCLIEDTPGRLVLGLYGTGFGVLDLENKSFRTENVFTKDYIISSLFKDSFGAIWMATSGAGLYRIKLSSLKEGSKVTDIAYSTTAQGMPSNTVRNMLEDDEKMLWITTSDGLVEMDARSFTIKKTYLQKDNVIGSQFSYCKGYESSDGNFYFGTYNGLLGFDPEYLREIFRNVPLKITAVSILSDLGNNHLQNPDGHFVITEDTFTVRKKDAAYVKVSFSPMTYGDPNSSNYLCRLSATGFNNEFTTNEGSMAFTNLRPGAYTFTVNYLGSDDPATEAGIDIVIKANWYYSIVAKLIYLSLICSALWLIYRSRKRRDQEETARKNELLEAKKEKDIVHEKMELLTNIAHEIRTPVSVIQILMDKISSVGKLPANVSGEFDSMRLNIDNLKKLCNDLLDFRKLESGQSMLVFADEDIQPVCLKVVDSFATAANNKGISLQASIPDTPIMVHCDDSAIESVLCNLIGNAVKYCKSSIVLKVTEDADTVFLRVENDGDRISEIEKENIFNAFYQLDSNKGTGSGLGLTYSRKIAEMHSGKLYLDTDVKDMTSFVFEIPKSKSYNKVPAQAVSEESMSTVDVEVKSIEDNPDTTILVVEDNKPMRELIRDELSKDYNTVAAADGLEALQIVKTQKIDLVVSDIMMPGMDGCQLCNAIKEDIELSHIPVLLLTAAVGIETHIRSLKSGADAYIEKPFKMDVLKENINALFRNRDIRNRQFSTSPLSHLSCSTVSKVEQDFINKLHDYIIEHISETELTIGVLADVMNVSKPTLARKIKAATGLTMNEYVRLCRLKLAAEMLAENKYRINEVAYLVGYSSPSYFAQCFQKQFNKLPSDFIKN